MGELRGFTFIPEEETTGAEGFKAGTSKPRATSHLFTRFLPASPTEEEIEKV